MSDLVGNPEDRFSHKKAHIEYCNYTNTSTMTVLWLHNVAHIRITCPCNEQPLTPHFYIEKVGFTRVYIFFLFLLQNIDCGYSLEPPHLLRVPTIYVLSKNKKKYQNFHLKIIIFTAVKYCSILHGHVCVMIICSDFAENHSFICKKIILHKLFIVADKNHMSHVMTHEKT